MHIALVSQEYPPARHGGIGAQARAKAATLAMMGHEVTVITHCVSDQREESDSGLLRTIRIPGNRHLVSGSETARWLTYSVSVAEEIESIHCRHALDLVEFAEWGAEGYAFLLNRSEYNSIPCVLQLHGPLVMFAKTMNWPSEDSEFYRVGTHMESTCVRLADAVYSSSQCSIDWCSKHYGLANVDVPVIHTGVDTDAFCPCDVSKERSPTIVFVGKLVENKGVLDLALSARELLPEFPDLQVWLIGGGEKSVVEQLRSIAMQVPRSDFLQLRGFVPHDELPQTLSRAHVFAAPSIYEGGPGFVYLEAMSCGIPVVACSGSGASEVIASDETGILVPPKDGQALTGALRRLLSEDASRDEMGRRARQYVVTHADSRACLQRLVEFYESVIARGGRRRLSC